MVKIYTTKELSDFLGISAKIIRDYDNFGLISVQRDSNNYRIFTSDDVRLIACIRLLSLYGKSFQEIKTIIFKSNTDEIQEYSINSGNKKLIDINNKISIIDEKIKSLQSSNII
uniref:TclU n=1 Tax=Macrococcoides caseolyticum TaxID=69966 RepID=A0A097PT75_9STAP|nr:MerR family transcriptional regulator [Macrococcus caseolyticus]AIU53951.1 TclU [Macrococcus caseolyticus]